MALKGILASGFGGDWLRRKLDTQDSNPYEYLSTLNPEQQQGFSQLMQMLMGQASSGQGLNNQVGGYLQDLFSNSPESFDKFAAPYKKQFEEQTIPGIAERFSGLGSGAQNSSAFQQALGQAGAGLSENLAALRGGMQQQGVGQAMQFGQQPTSNLLQLLGLNTQAIMPKQKPWWQELLTSLAPHAGRAAASFMGG